MSHLFYCIAEANAEVKSLAAVILRRNISSTSTESQDLTNADNNVNIWKRMTPEAKNFVKTELLKAINDCTDKNTIHKICSLLIEVQGTLFDQEEQIWQELLNLIFIFVNSDQDIKVDAALTIFNGLFSYLMDHLVKFKGDLMAIF